MQGHQPVPAPLWGTCASFKPDYCLKPAAFQLLHPQLSGHTTSTSRRFNKQRRHLALIAQSQYNYNSGSNLGELQRVIESDPGSDDPYGMQRVSADSFSSRGFYTDSTSIASSLLLLVLLLALTFQRILGLDRFVIKALREWRDWRELSRRTDILQARESLEEQWEPGAGGGDSSSSGGSNDSGQQ